MTPNDHPAGSTSSSRRSAQLRMIGVIVLVLGIGGAGTIYKLGTRTTDLSHDPSMLRYNKAESRQMGMLYGKQGLLIEEWSDDLKRPGTQATILLTVAVLGALGCFYFARLLDDDGKTN